MSETKSSIDVADVQGDAPPFEIGVDLANAADKVLVLDSPDISPAEYPAEYAELQARGAAMNALATMPDFWKSRFEVLVRKHGDTRLGRRAAASLLRKYASWTKRTAALRALQAEARAEKQAAAEVGT